MWILFAFGSALFAGITSVLAKCGIQKNGFNCSNSNSYDDCPYIFLDYGIYHGLTIANYND